MGSPKSATPVSQPFWKGIGLRTLCVMIAWAALALCAPLPAETEAVHSLKTGWLMQAGDPRTESGPWIPVDPSKPTPAPDGHPHDGIAWFRRDMAGSTQPMALGLSIWGQAMEVYWDGRCIGKAGRIGPLPVPGPLDRLLVFPLPSGEGLHRLELRVQTDVAGRLAHGFRGFHLSLNVMHGPEPAVRFQAEVISQGAQGYRLRKTIPDLILAVTFIMVGLWHLQHFLIRRKARENLWFGITALLMGFRQISYGGGPLGWSIPAFRVYQVQVMVSYAACVIFIEFTRCLSSPAMARRLRNYQWSFLLPMFALFALTPAWSEWVGDRIGPFWALPIPIALLVVLIRRYRMKDPDAKFLLGGATLLTLGLLYDIAYSLGLFTPVNALSWTFALFLCSMAVLANIRSVRAQEESARLARELDAQIQERQRLSRELHDGIGGHLSSAILLTDALARRMEASDATTRLPLLGDVLGQCMSELRSLMWIIQDAETSLGDLALQMRETLTRRLFPHGLALEFSADFENPSIPLSRTTRFHLLRVVQEWTTNTLKHAGATGISIHLQAKEGELAIHYADNGRGFDHEKIQPQRYGMANVRHRCIEIRGKLEIQTAMGQGFQIKLRIPLSAVPKPT